MLRNIIGLAGEIDSVCVTRATNDGFVFVDFNRVDWGAQLLIAQLTPSGMELMETAERVARVIETRLWQGVPDSGVEALNKTLMRCLANLDGDA